MLISHQQIFPEKCHKLHQLSTTDALCSSSSGASCSSLLLKVGDISSLQLFCLLLFVVHHSYRSRFWCQISAFRYILHNTDNHQKVCSGSVLWSCGRSRLLKFPLSDSPILHRNLRLLNTATSSMIALLNEARAQHDREAEHMLHRVLSHGPWLSALVSILAWRCTDAFAVFRRKKKYHTVYRNTSQRPVAFLTSGRPIQGRSRPFDALKIII